MKRVTEIWPNWLTENEDEAYIIAALAAKALAYDNNQEADKKRFMWLYNTVGPLSLEYYGNHGNKYITPLVCKLLGDNDSMDIEKSQKLAEIIFNRYKDRWIKLSDLYSLEYDPIENYASVEVRTPNTTTTVTNDVDLTVTNNQGVKNDVYGFNSVEPVGQNEATQENTQTTTGTGDKNKSIETRAGDETITRRGNIGVTTSQQMLQSEIDLWKNWDFITEFFKDLDSIITLKIY